MILVPVIISIVIGAYYIERAVGGGISSLQDAFWWAVQTITTLGYGDVTPVTAGGRIMASILLVVGFGLIPFVTAIAASHTVTRRLREERGLKKIKVRNHIVICGWNKHLETIIDGLIDSQGQPEIVLVNSLPVEDMDELLLRYKSIELSFVHGDFTSETILGLSNIGHAASVIILTDTTRGDIAGADQRAVLATLAVRSMNPKARICIEVTEPSVASHARMAGADEVIIHGEYDPFLLTSAATTEGIVLAAQQLLSHCKGNCLQQKCIPSEFVGKSFAELSAHFREKYNAMLIGLVSKSKSLRAEDVLGGDYSMIDDFIERKLKEVGRDYVVSQLEIPQANLNPDSNYIIKNNEAAIVIAR
jgi:voltage-gated potassium channel